MTDLLTMRRGALAIALVAAIAIAGCGEKSGSSPFGKTLVVSHTVPSEKLAEFAALQPAAKDSKRSAIENVALADGVEWAAPAIDVTTRESPYRLAIRVDATAPAAGPATSMWLAGWAKLDKQGDPEATRSVIVPSIGDADLPADRLTGPRTLSRVDASSPVTFKQDARFVPVIELKALRNMTLKRVDVEIWSGLPSASWIELLFGWQSALIGVVMLGLWFLWFRKPD